MSDKGKTAMLILAGRPKPKGDEDMPSLEDVMGDFIAAVKSGDAEAAADAWRAAKDCEGYSEEEE
jgi:hypothetical protein